jgi:cysteinyl-tRNA synthetase
MVVNAPAPEGDQPPDEIVALAARRLLARTERKWAESDRLRDEIAALGWSVRDSKDGYELLKIL